MTHDEYEKGLGEAVDWALDKRSATALAVIFLARCVRDLYEVAAEMREIAYRDGR